MKNHERNEFADFRTKRTLEHFNPEPTERPVDTLILWVCVLGFIVAFCILTWGV